MPRFRQDNGLTAYAFACGYQQICKMAHCAGQEVTVTLERDSACWHVRVHGSDDGRISWESYALVVDARTAWRDAINTHMSPELKQVRKDARYLVTREYCGETEPMWVARFMGEWIGKRDTKAAAWAAAYDFDYNRLDSKAA